MVLPLVLSLWALAATPASAAAAPGSASTPTLLAGPWDFAPGATLAPGDPQWGSVEVRRVTLPASWNDQMWSGKPAPGPEGRGTYRLVLDRPGDGVDWSLAWTLAGSAARVWVDGVLKAQIGVLEGPGSVEVPANRPQLIGLGTGPRTEIVIQVSNHNHVDGGLWAPLVAGPTALLEPSGEAARAWDLLVAGALVLVGAAALTMGLGSRTLGAVLWFGLLSLVLGLRLLVHGHLAVYQLVPDLDWQWFQKLRHVTMYLGPLFFLRLLDHLFPASLRPWFLRASTALALVGLAVVVSLPYRWYGDALYPYFAVVLVQIGVAAGALWNRRRSVETHQTPVLLGLGVLLAGSAFEFARVVFFLPLPEILPVTTLGLVALLGGAVALQQRALVTQIQELNETKDTMLSIIAHDLRGPVLSASRYVRKHLLPEEIPLEDRREALGILAQTLERSGALLENLLAWSLSQSGRLTLAPRVLDARTLAQEAGADLEKQRLAKDQVLEIGWSNAKIWADPTTAATVVRNLLSNALKFTPVGGRVTVEIGRGADGVEVRVTDEGEGLDPSQLARVLSLKDKVVTPGTQGERGRGFGLFVCQEFLRRNGGRLRARSQVGRGSTFTAVFAAAPGRSVEKKER